MPRKNPKPATNTCATCGKPTANRLYCSVSCANRGAPKRKPEGACANCGEPLETRYRLCEKCRAIEEAQRKREAENIKEIVTLSSERIDFKASHICAKKVVVFELQGPFGNNLPFPLDAPCGELLDCLISLILSGPPYILPEHVHLFAAFLYDLKESSCQLRGSQDVVPAKSLTLSELPWVIESWLRHKITATEPDWYTITYALATAELIQLHTGQPQWQEQWRLTPMIQPTQEDGWTPVLGFLDKQFKKLVTEAIRGQLLWFQVPPEFKLLDAYQREIALPETRAMLLRIRRCHLSEWPTTELVARFEGPRRAEPTFGDDIYLLGDMLLGANLDFLKTVQDYLRWEGRPLPAEVPVDWATKTVKQSEDGNLLLELCVPKWDPST